MKNIQYIKYCVDLIAPSSRFLIDNIENVENHIDFTSKVAIGFFLILLVKSI